MSEIQTLDGKLQAVVDMLRECADTVPFFVRAQPVLRAIADGIEKDAKRRKLEDQPAPVASAGGVGDESQGAGTGREAEERSAEKEPVNVSSPASPPGLEASDTYGECFECKSPLFKPSPSRGPVCLACNPSFLPSPQPAKAVEGEIAGLVEEWRWVNQPFTHQNAAECLRAIRAAGDKLAAELEQMAGENARLMAALQSETLRVAGAEVAVEKARELATNFRNGAELAFQELLASLPTRQE